MPKSYAGCWKGYLTKGERVAYRNKMNQKEQCLMPDCKGKKENMGYCLNHFPKK